MNNQDPAASILRLITLLDVERLDANLFRGQSTNAGWSRVYGGQVVAQALMAAAKTVDDGRLCHSLHSYFMRPGDPAHPIDYQVERDRDGASFTTRRIIALQKGRPIFNMAASFQTQEAGLTHGSTPPQVPEAQDLPSEMALAERHSARMPEPQRSLWRERDRPIEFRPLDPSNPFKPSAKPAFAQHWVRAAAPFSVPAPVMRALFAYASDMTLLDTCMLPHAIAWHDKRLQVASLDHAIWFNATPDLNDWLLFDQDSPSAAGGRGLNRAVVYDRAGAVVANIVQEGLIRYREADAG
jgi:acyl-CoA thioesterase-2